MKVGEAGARMWEGDGRWGWLVVTEREWGKKVERKT